MNEPGFPRRSHFPASEAVARSETRYRIRSGPRPAKRPSKTRRSYCSQRCATSADEIERKDGSRICSLRRSRSSRTRSRRAVISGGLRYGPTADSSDEAGSGDDAAGAASMAFTPTGSLCDISCALDYFRPDPARPSFRSGSMDRVVVALLPPNPHPRSFPHMPR